MSSGAPDCNNALSGLFCLLVAPLLDFATERLIVTETRNVSRAYERASRQLLMLDIDAPDQRLCTDNPGLSIPPDTLASMYSTSGSTGQPKGVVASHRIRMVNAMRTSNTLRTCADDRLILLYAASFSGAVNTTFGALLNGARLSPFDLRLEGAGRNSLFRRRGRPCAGGPRGRAVGLIAPFITTDPTGL